MLPRRKGSSPAQPSIGYPTDSRERPARHPADGDPSWPGHELAETKAQWAGHEDQTMCRGTLPTSANRGPNLWSEVTAGKDRHLSPDACARKGRNVTLASAGGGGMEEKWLISATIRFKILGQHGRTCGAGASTDRLEAATPESRQPVSSPAPRNPSGITLSPRWGEPSTRREALPPPVSIC
jgi:hypothetical protein